MCAISDNLLFVTTYAGYIYCLDARTGKQHWVYDALADVWGSPMIADGKVYFGTEEGDVLVFEVSKACRLIAKNIMDESGWSSINGAGAVAANNTLYVMSKNRLYALVEREKK